MNHAFIITAHKNGDQLERLIEQLEGENSFFYIHIDKKSELFKDNVLKKIKNKNNVFFPSKFINVYWGGFSHLKAIILLLNEAIKNKKIDYFHAISGQDFPITAFKKFDDFFIKNNGNEYITHFILPSPNWLEGGLGRVEHYHLNDIFDPKKKLFTLINRRVISFQKSLKIKRQKPPCFQQYHGGGTWWSLSKNAIEYIFELINKEPKLLSRYKYTHCSEEIFFQTVLMNSKFKDKIIDNDLRYIDWNTRNGNCPANLDENDFVSIINSHDFFARKIELPVSEKLRSTLIEHIDSK